MAKVSATAPALAEEPAGEDLPDLQDKDVQRVTKKLQLAFKSKKLPVTTGNTSPTASKRIPSPDIVNTVSAAASAQAATALASALVSATSGDERVTVDKTSNRPGSKSKSNKKKTPDKQTNKPMAASTKTAGLVSASPFAHQAEKLRKFQDQIGIVKFQITLFGFFHFSQVSNQINRKRIWFIFLVFRQGWK